MAYPARIIEQIVGGLSASAKDLGSSEKSQKGTQREKRSNHNQVPKI